MLHNQQAQNPSKSSKDNLPSWVKFHLKEFDEVRYSAGVIMGHHLVVFVANEIWDEAHPGNPRYLDSTACLLAFNLEDHSIQRAEMNDTYFKPKDGYCSFLKYGENQIIKYTPFSRYSRSFNMGIPKKNKAFKVEYEGIKDESGTEFSNFIAQIEKDSLYVFGKVENKDNQLWSFDLKNRVWKLCETTGEAPPSERFPCKSSYNKIIVFDSSPESFIYQDNLCLYGTLKERSRLGDLFMLDLSKEFPSNCYLILDSMVWKKIEQEEKYLGETKRDPRGLSGTVYQDHFVTLRREVDNRKSGIALCFLNLHTKNTWSFFDLKNSAWTKSILAMALTNGLMTYKNLFLALTTDQDESLLLAFMEIDNFEISALKSAEEEHLSGLFMSQENSDITLKIEDQLIPAHKEILVRKSKYFAGLFNSKMAESTQDVIEIQDCEYEVFKEYLRWIYEGTTNIKDESQAIKLYILADKYVQEDLCKKCLNFLTFIINMENIYTIHAFAYQENLAALKSWCLSTCKDKIYSKNISGLIKYLDDHQGDSEFKENNKEFRHFALNFVLDRFFDISKNEKGEMKIYEDFLVKNIEIETIPPLARFLGCDDEFAKNPERKEIFEKSTIKLKEAVFGFFEENAEIFMTSKIAKDFPIGFMTGVFLFTAKNLKKIKVELKNVKERIEPSHVEENNQLTKNLIQEMKTSVGDFIINSDG